MFQQQIHVLRIPQNIMVWTTSHVPSATWNVVLPPISYRLLVPVKAGVFRCSLLRCLKRWNYRFLQRCRFVGEFYFSSRQHCGISFFVSSYAHFIVYIRQTLICICPRGQCFNSSRFYTFTFTLVIFTSEFSSWIWGRLLHCSSCSLFNNQYLAL